MTARALLYTSLLLWMAQHTLQGGVRPQTSALRRILPVTGASYGMGGAKPASFGALGALGARGYGSKLGKNTGGRFAPSAHLGGVGYRGPGAGRGALKQGIGYGNPGGYGASLGTGMGMPMGAGFDNGLGLGHHQGGKRDGVYGGGYASQPGYGAVAGVGYPGARPGYFEGVGNYPGANLGTAGFGAGLGQGGYPLAVGAGKHGGYGNGYGAGANGYGAGAYAGQVPRAFGGVGSVPVGAGGVYGEAQALGLGAEPGLGGVVGELSHGGAPMIPTGLEGDGSYPYGGQQLGLGASAAKSANKYAAGYGAQPAGYGAQLGAGQDSYGGQGGKNGNGFLGNGYKG